MLEFFHNKSVFKRKLETLKIRAKVNKTYKQICNRMTQQKPPFLKWSTKLTNIGQIDQAKI